jgi:GGDEF domain-containing protein
MLRSVERLQVLRALLSADEELGLIATRREVIFERDGGWQRPNGTSVTASFWLKVFRFILRKPGVRQAADTLVWGFPDLAAVVAIRLIPTATNDERERADRIVRRLIDHTGDKFAADFDKLTNAPNRRQMERRLDGLAKSVAEFASPATDRVAVVMMLDLDNFKQANDSGGHDFGDALLQVTAWRLHDVVGKWATEGEATDLSAGRWGGEEFLVAGLFPGDVEVIGKLAAALVECFADPAMPNEAEVARLQRLTQNPTAKFPLPKPPVTASLGWCIMRQPVDVKEVPVVVQDAVARADTAMYRAKSTGKNRAVGFAEIKARHGRILLHRTDAGVVVLDIGDFVGVRKGDTFDVYPEDFADRRPYVHRDGRTERALGKYPAFSVARIQVKTDPEREIAFCIFLRLRRGVGQLSERAHVKFVEGGKDEPETVDKPLIDVGQPMPSE